MKNLRGNVLTLVAAMMAASIAHQAIAQQPPPGSMPLGSPVAPPAFANAAYGPGVQQGVIMPPPQAMYNLPVPPGYGPEAYGPAAYGPAAYGPQAYGPGAAMQPNWGVQPASYGQPQPFPAMGGGAVPAAYEMGGGYGDAGGYGYGDGGGYGADGGHGGGGPGLGERLVSRLLPYAEGGQCAPRWYDIAVDGIYLKREKASRTIDFTSDGINGDIILSTDDLDFQEDLGLRFTGAHQIFAGATLEFTYFGLLDWSTSAVNRPTQFPDDAFSIFSQFGTDPPPDPSLPGSGGFDETDRSRQQSLAYESSVDNFELNVRKRFTAPNCRLQYSCLVGVRYFYLLEDFQYNTLGGDDDLIMPGLQSRGLMNYDVGTRNSLTGFQLGGDAWLNLVPGVNIGADIKAGVYGNYANQTTSILATTTTPAFGSTFNESINVYDIAMVADANLYFMWRLGPHWSVRAGYSFMFVEGVALAPENFNGVPPNIFTPSAGGAGPTQSRVGSINRNGNVFYHGGFGGVEYSW